MKKNTAGEARKWFQAGGQRLEHHSPRVLYDHQDDPMENMNVSEFTENRKLVERLSKMLRQGWRSGLGNALVSPNP